MRCRRSEERSVIVISVVRINIRIIARVVGNNIAILIPKPVYHIREITIIIHPLHGQ